MGINWGAASAGEDEPKGRVGDPFRKVPNRGGGGGALDEIRPSSTSIRTSDSSVPETQEFDLLPPPTGVMNVITARRQGKSEMTTYTIDTENNITAHASKQEAGEGETFSSQQDLARMVAEWSPAG